VLASCPKLLSWANSSTNANHSCTDKHITTAPPQGVLASCPKLLSCQPESVAAKVEGLAEVLGLQQARDLATK
jgi:hypothetical protein